MSDAYKLHNLECVAFNYDRMQDELLRLRRSISAGNKDRVRGALNLIETFADYVLDVLDQADSDAPFMLSCSCDYDASNIESYEDAIAAGWQNVYRDVGGLSWSDLGTCPDCARPDVPGQLDLFAETTDA